MISDLETIKMHVVRFRIYILAPYARQISKTVNKSGDDPWSSQVVAPRMPSQACWQDPAERGPGNACAARRSAPGRNIN